MINSSVRIAPIYEHEKTFTQSQVEGSQLFIDHSSVEQPTYEVQFSERHGHASTSLHPSMPASLMAGLPKHSKACKISVAPEEIREETDIHTVFNFSIYRCASSVLKKLDV